RAGLGDTFPRKSSRTNRPTSSIRSFRRIPKPSRRGRASLRFRPTVSNLYVPRSYPETVSRPARNTWLADPVQPAARYRYLVEIEGASPESDEARVARAQIPRHGWAADILRRQDARGFWVHRKTLYRPKYVATNWRLLALAH